MLPASGEEAASRLTAVGRGLRIAQPLPATAKSARKAFRPHSGFEVR